MKNNLILLSLIFILSCKEDDVSDGYYPYYNGKVCIELSLSQQRKIDAYMHKQGKGHHFVITDTNAITKDCLQDTEPLQIWQIHMEGDSDTTKRILDFVYYSSVTALITQDSNHFFIQSKEDITKPDSIQSFFSYIRKHNIQQEQPIFFDKFYNQYKMGYNCSRFSKDFLLKLGFSDSIATKYADIKTAELWAYDNNFHRSTAYVTWAGTPPPLPFSAFYTAVLYNRKNKECEVIVKEVPARGGDGGYWLSLFTSSPEGCKCEKKTK